MRSIRHLVAAALAFAFAAPAGADVALPPRPGVTKHPPSPRPGPAGSAGNGRPATIIRHPIRHLHPIYEFPDDDPILGEPPAPPPGPQDAAPVPLDGPYTTPGDVCTILVRDCATHPHDQAICSGKPIATGIGQAPWLELAVYETRCLDDAKQGMGETRRHLAVRTTAGWWFAMVDRSRTWPAMETRFTVDRLGSVGRPNGANGALPAVELRYSIRVVQSQSAATRGATEHLLSIEATATGAPMLKRRGASRGNSREVVAPPSFPITAPE